MAFCRLVRGSGGDDDSGDKDAKVRVRSGCFDRDTQEDAKGNVEVIELFIELESGNGKIFA